MSTPSSARPVRVRIGPSPTGEPHVGTAYIALFNMSFARKNGGKFVLRIEDTDQERSRREWETQIIDGLHWLGIDWDEGPDVGGPHGPYRQSERQQIHKAHAEILIRKGAAYRCFCTKERLDELRAIQKVERTASGYDRRCRELEPREIEENLKASSPFVIRMKMPTSGQTIVHDRLRGEVAFENAAIDDQVLLKSDGYPTYHLANVVDDHLMEISHVIRAEEWINSTPKHIILYSMFGWEPPVWVHMPLLRNKDQSKISKRKNPVSILDYKQRGFLPEAVLNYLAMLGWTMPDGREIFSVQDFIDNLDFDRMSLGGPIFDLEKFTWLNGKYFREKKTEEELTLLLQDELFSLDRLRKIVPLVRERIDKAEDFIGATDFFFTGDVKLEAKDLKPKGRTFKELALVLEELVSVLETQVDYSPKALEELLRLFAEKSGWKTKDLFMPVRVAVTGRSATPPLFDTLSVLGRALVRRRIRNAIEFTKTQKEIEGETKPINKL